MRAEDILSLRIGPEDRAIGYGKGAYVFHMLRVMLGDEVFYNALRDVIANRGFKFTSWEDFRISFEKVSGKDFGEREILDAYFRVASSLEHGSVKNDKEVTEEDLRNHSLYILGGVGENILMDKFISILPSEIRIEGESISANGRAYNKKDSVLVVAIPNPYNPGSVLLLFSGYKPEYIASLGERLSHYGKYSYLLFVNGENKEKGVWNVERLRKTF